MEDIKKLFQEYSKDAIAAIETIPQSGGDRVYFRIRTATDSFIATRNDNVKENEAFIYFSQYFKNAFCPVPEILLVDKENKLYLQQDVGATSLLNILEAEGHTDHVFSLFQKSLLALANLQVNGGNGLNYDYCITSAAFGKQAIISDLLYFKYYFLDTLKIPYDKEKLVSEFDTLSTYLSNADHKYFMFRDFQSRNIIVKDDAVHFIDYQGGMKGAVQYDVASLLWQAKAALSDEWKNNLLQYYISCLETILQQPVDKARFETEYNGYVLIRLLQVLGAYGFRGLFERKAHFLTSIPLALQNLQWFINHKKIGVVLPEFERLLQLIVADEVVKRFEPVKAHAGTPLLVKVNSFSFIKTGYPKDETANGGGYVFDTRGILNPGRIAAYKTLTGRDKLVKDYLEQQTKMPEFLNSVYNIVDISVENYITRGFGNLTINFGCTGGQHRSVYAAEAIARHLKIKFNVKVQLDHNNKENWKSE
ncbi:MAG: phosphotransferase [Ferruginibacter sp.]|nr:phosphotransferase [Ferruginibacter sp.]